MESKQYFVISIYIMGFAELIISTNVYCPDDQLCDCTPESIKCICLQQENIFFQKGESFMGKEIIVKGCGEVKLPTSFVKNLVTESFLILDVLKLHIAQYAFKGGSIRKLSIGNISDFTLEPFSLSHIKNVSNLKISNVFLEHLPNFVTWNTDAQNVEIMNSHVGAILAGAFKMENMESFLLENNTVDDLSGSIEISNIKYFSFIRNVVKNTGFYSISLYMADNVEFAYCNFLQINSSMIYTRDIELFSFHDNRIESCEKKAFWHVQANTKVSFLNNQIVSANNDSLIPNLSPKAVDLRIIESFNNTFVCDCNLEWLLNNSNPSYNFIKERSVCYDPPYLANLKLSQLKLSINNVGTCISVEKVSVASAMPKITKVKSILETSETSSNTEISTSPRSETLLSQKDALLSPKTEISTNQKVVASISPNAEAIHETDLSINPKSETSPSWKIVTQISPKTMTSSSHSTHNEKRHKQNLNNTSEYMPTNIKSERPRSPKIMIPTNSKVDISKESSEIDISRIPKSAVSTIQKSDVSTNLKMETPKHSKAEISAKLKRDTEEGTETESSKTNTAVTQKTDPKADASVTPEADSKIQNPASSMTDKSITTEPKSSESSKETTPTSLEEATPGNPKTDLVTTPKSEISASTKTKTTISSKTETPTNSKTKTTTSSKTETITSAKSQTETSSKMDTTTSPKTEKTTSSKMETTTSPKSQTATTSKMETTISPKTERTTSSKTETTTSPKSQTATVSKMETTTIPKTETAISKTETTTTGQKSQTATTSKMETTTSPKTETASSKTETKTSPPVKDLSSTTTTTAKPSNRSAELYISTFLLLFSLSFLIIWCL